MILLMPQRLLTAAGGHVTPTPLQDIYVTIRNFKSIEDLALTLRPRRPLVLIGPPASGKSNLLEALALYAFAERAVVEAGLLHSYPSPSAVAPLDTLVRMVKCSDMYRAGSTTPPMVEVRSTIPEAYTRVTGSCDEADTTAEIVLEAGRGDEPDVRIKVKTSIDAARQLPLNLPVTESDEALGFLLALFTSIAASKKDRDRVRVVTEKGPEARDAVGFVNRYPFLSPRLYGFDRLGAVRKIALGATGVRYPSYLAEDASNLGWMLYRYKDLIEDVNRVITEVSGVEVRPLADGSLAFFDGIRDIGAVNASDTVVRLVYALAALGTADKPPYPIVMPLLMLEEPEAHTYPITRHGLVERIGEAAQHAYIIITTHSGRLAQLLWQKLDAEILYVTRKDGSTRLYKVKPELLLDSLEDIEDLINSYDVDILEHYVSRGVLEPLDSAGTGAEA